MRIDADHRLATYGSLAPGEENHHQLSDHEGNWRVGRIRGHRIPKGWGAATGYPALILDDDGPFVEIHPFESADLPAHLDRLDAFEGSEYRRTRVLIDTSDGPLDAWIYLAADR